MPEFSEKIPENADKKSFVYKVLQIKYKNRFIARNCEGTE